MATSKEANVKQSFLFKVREFFAQIKNSLSKFFKPDNIEEVPVSNLPVFLRNSLALIDKIVSHYKPGQKNGISFDEPVVTEKQNVKAKAAISKEKAKNEKKIYKDLDNFSSILKGEKNVNKTDERDKE